MAFTNLPANLQDMFNGIYDRLSKLESGPNQPLYVADAAQATAVSAQGSATAAYNLAVSAEIDAQAASAAAAAAQAKANTAIQVSASTIVNASNQLTAINGSGITVYSGSSSSSGARVLLNSQGFLAYNSSNTPTLTISSSDGSISMLGSLTAGSNISGATVTGGVVQTSDGGTAVALVGTQNGIGFKYGGSYSGWMSSIDSAGIVANYGSSPGASNYPQQRLTSGAATLSGTASSGFSANTNGTNGITGTTTHYNAATFSSTVTVQQEFYASYGGSNTVTNTPNAWMSTNGQLRRSTSSSQRYKTSIVNLDTVADLDPKKLYDLPVRAFKYREGQLAETDSRYDTLMPGFIAEEVAAIYPIAADFEDGAESWNDRIVVPALLSLIQDLNARVIELESKVQ